ncbi:hypothetical protein SKAU_G00395940 [Synaphobranchus kaupii]|uniref:GB1/RHD3-type G domain-containing protein n=1 Tax=Synaphobranchus kaupii TaxID=118154 RepID=A0A9Q1ECG0_SYNKA|nr:hypothetical protein SKAU_G00395940 [Synaphobranchus kaupii]
MNRLAGKTTGFPLGSTIQSETKGIWMWCVPHPRRDDVTLVLLDTEGLGDVEKEDEKNDTWIFALVILLSSTLVYNSMRTIDHQALRNLHEEGEGEASADYAQFLPSFVWTMRDFTLDLLFDGRRITPDEYLEKSLKIQSVLGNLAVMYVDAIRSESVPCLENAVAALSKIENSAAVEESCALYRRLLGERVVPDPKIGAVGEKDLSGVHDECLQEALGLFKTNSFKDEDERYQKDLIEQIKEVYHGKCSENAELFLCNSLLQRLSEKLGHASYLRPGGYADYRIQLDSIVQTYRATPGKGVQADQVLEAFLKDREENIRDIRRTDKVLTQRMHLLKEDKTRADRQRYEAEAEAAQREKKVMERRLGELRARGVHTEH